jgi:CubicO group peptidase (beta-lactamase class C family)
MFLRHVHFTFVSLILVATCSFSQSPDLNAIDEFVVKVMKTFEVPGIGLAIVKDGKIVLAKGYGVRKLGEQTPVDGHTLFGIASNTKAFTATAIGLLVEEGKLEWDAPVIKYLPWFQLSDPYVTHEITIRDLLVHRSGLSLGAGDLLWWPPTTYKRKEIAQRLRHIPLATSFRSAYAYDNVLYLIAGEVIEAVSGKTWEEFVKTRILDKVGMTESKLFHNSDPITGNVASTHAKVDGKVQQVLPFVEMNSNPAAGITAGAEDMAKWMIVQLDSGRLADGSRLFARSTARELWSIVTPFPSGNAPSPELQPLFANYSGYALGFGIRDYRGKKVISHTGGLPGYVSRLTMIPELKLGVVVLTNQESGSAFNAITYEILDRYLNAPPHDWLTAFKHSQERGDSSTKATEQSAITARNADSRPPLPLEKYAGTYTDAWYGDVMITLEGKKLSMKFSRTPWLEGTLEHSQYDTFIARWTDRTLRADAYVTFYLTPEGAIDQVKMKAVSPATDFSFDFQDLVLKPSTSEK